MARQATFAPGENGVWAPLRAARTKTIRHDPIAVAEKHLNAIYNPATGQYIAKPVPLTTDERARARVDPLDGLLRDVPLTEAKKERLRRSMTNVKNGGLAMDYWLDNLPSPHKAAKAKLLGTSPTRARPISPEAITLELIHPEEAAKVKPLQASPTKARPVPVENWVTGVISPTPAAKERISLLSPVQFATQKVPVSQAQSLSPVQAKPKAVELPDGQAVVRGKALRVGKDGKVREIEFTEDHEVPIDITLGSRPERKVRHAVEPLGKVEREVEPELIRVVDDKGNVIGVAKAPAQPAKLSPTAELAKARVLFEEPEEVAADSVKPASTLEEEIKQARELIKLRQEVKAFDARCEQEDAIPDRATETPESEKIDSLREMRKKLEGLKTARRNEDWEIVKADIDKAHDRIDARRVARGKKKLEPEAAGWEDISPVGAAPRSRRDVEVAPPRAEQEVRDTGLRRRKSALVRADSGGQSSS
jgi:hypothetical protein